MLHFPHKIPFPSTSDADYLKQAADDILAILQKPKPTLPYLQTGDTMKDAIEQTALLLDRAIMRVKPPKPARQLPSDPNRSQNSLQTPSPVPQSSPNPVQSPRVEQQQNPPMPHIIPDVINTVTAPFMPPPHATNFKSFAFQSFLAQEIFTHRANHIYNAATGKRETPESLLNGKDKIIWGKAASNEWGRLAQGNKFGVKATDTITFIPSHEVPRDRDITYVSMVFDHRPLKSEPFRCRIVVGGDKLTYDADASTPTTDLTETKLLLNSVISDAWKGARFCSADLKDFFLASPMDKPEYAKVHIKYIPQDIIEQYNLLDIIHNDYAYIKIKRGMYGLKQAALLAYQQLVKFLKPAGYAPIANSVGMWKHKTRGTIFCLCVDDFGIKYMNTEDLTHLLSTLQSHYGVTVDKEGKNFCGLTLDWNYSKGYVDISMPGYINKVLHKYQHPTPTRPEYAPHQHVEPVYGAKQQITTVDTSSPLDKKGIRRIQGIIGSLLFYGRAIDNTMLTAINDISGQQASATMNTKKATNKLLDYAATYPNTKIRYYASEMVLYVESDAAYLVQPNARSRVTGLFYLSNKSPNRPHPSPKRNGPLNIECKTIRNVVASAAEAETNGLFHNAREALPIRHILMDMGHPQPPTPIKTDNSTAISFVQSNIKQKRSKSWDMRLNWLRDREKTHKQFHFYWDKGINNDADYHTKHHAPKHHLRERYKYVHVDGYEQDFVTSPHHIALCAQMVSRAARVC